MAQVDGHAYLYSVLKRRSRLVLSSKQDQDQLTNQKEEEEHDHREFWLRRRKNMIYNIMLFIFNYIVINLPLLDTNTV